MRVQHNIAAINANRNLTGNNNSVSKSLEKLSSGYRINRAGDDAAGLAISEKMRAQIKCLDQAETNCNDGISLIQTAEGALQEVHSMLNRMTEIAEQSANGTYDNAVDRKNLDDEVNQLKSEIDRISKATNFNGINLLDGTLGGYKTNFTAASKSATKGFTGFEVSGGALANSDEVKLTGGANGAITIASISGKALSAIQSAGIDVVDSQTRQNSDGTFTTILKLGIVDEAKAAATAAAPLADKLNGLVITATSKNGKAAGSLTAKLPTKGDVGGGLTLQIGDTSDKFNKLTVAVGDMSTKGLSLTNVSVKDQASAADAVKTIKNAINQVSSTRGNLGAMQNRLEHTVNNLSVTNENMTNAESRIRDTDMAKEMMTYTSKNILAQAAQSMLAQANQQPQAVLSLLQ